MPVVVGAEARARVNRVLDGIHTPTIGTSLDELEALTTDELLFVMLGLHPGVLPHYGPMMQMLIQRRLTDATVNEMATLRGQLETSSATTSKLNSRLLAFTAVMTVLTAVMAALAFLTWWKSQGA